MNPLTTTIAVPGGPSLLVADSEPRIASYAYPGRDPMAGGAPQGFLATVLDLSTGAYRSTNEDGASIACELDAGPDRARWRVSVYVGGARAGIVDVEVRALQSGACATSTLVLEEAGWHLVSVTLPLLSVCAEPGAVLVLPSRSGRLVRVAQAAPERGVHCVEWYSPAPVAVAAHDGAAAALSLDTVDSHLVHEIDGTPPRGVLGVELVHRHRVGRPELSFVAQRSAACTVHAAEPPPSEPADWTLAARAVRDTIEPNLNPLYVGALVYKVMLQAPGDPRITTYADVLDLVRRVHRLTGGARQVVYLVGWQHGGHDTGYPDVFTPNASVGTFEEFRALAEAARALNAVVSVHDNYHDTYLDSPAFDPSVVARDRNGDLKKGGIWGGRQAYELGPAKYAEPARERAERTVAMLGLRHTIHLDVLSDKPDMVDFDPAAPASRERNAEGKRGIIAAFRKLGVDVTSEVLTSPFVGDISHFWHAIHRPAEGWPPHARVPLASLLYHGKVTAGGDASTDADKLDQLLYGWTLSADWTKETSDDVIAESFFLVSVPWALLADRRVESYRREGEFETVTYAGPGGATFVTVNHVTQAYRVVVDGVQVARDFVTCAPLENGSLGVYARAGGSVNIPGALLPPGGGAVRRADGGRAPALARAGPEWRLEAPPRTPLFVWPDR